MEKKTKEEAVNNIKAVSFYAKYKDGRFEQVTGAYINVNQHTGQILIMATDSSVVAVFDSTTSVVTKR